MDECLQAPDHAERWDRLSHWLNAWLIADASGRERLRAELADAAPDLVADADALARSSGQLGAFLETPALVLAARALAEEDVPLRPGSRVGPYQVVGLLARGGMGDVYRASDLHLHRDVALKVMAHGRTHDPQRLDRFIREARLTAALDHPNVVRVYDAGRFEDRAYLVAEMLEGETLRARIARGALPVEDVLLISVQIVRGLAAAHEAGLVHRDLKPENIFLTDAGAVKILDFGIAKLAQDESVRDGFSTLTGVVLGTVGYLAPEQVRGESVGVAADLFGVGALLFEMLTGIRAFQRAHVVETLYAILHESPPMALAERGDLPPALRAIVTRLLEKSPEARFASCAELLTALEDVGRSPGHAAPLASGTTLSSRNTSTVVRPAPDGAGAYVGDRAVRWTATGIFVAMTAVAGAWYILRPPPHGEAPLVVSSKAVGPQLQVVRPHSGNSQAVEAYLRGRAYLMKATRAELMLAADHFSRAVKLDPGFADAWAGLAQAYRRMPVGGDVRPRDAFEPAREAATTALRLDPQNPEAHAALGAVAFWHDWNYTEAERLLRHALALEPSSADARLFLAHVLSNLGRHDEALVEIRGARALNPGWPVAQSLEGQFLYMARRYDEALERLDAAVAIEPNFPTARVMRVYPLLALERYDDALEECAMVRELRRTVDRPERLYSWGAGLTGYALARVGRTAEAERTLEEIRSHAAEQYVSPYVEALVLHGLGRDHEALDQLEAAVEVRDHRVTFLRVDPKWDGLRHAPRFKTVLSRVNLPPRPD